MTIQGEIEVLESLAKVDREIATINEELGRERSTLETTKARVQELSDRISLAAGGLGQMERTRNELLTEVRQLGVQLERSREKLSRCRTEREANAVQREVEETRKLYRDREQEIEKLATLLEQARTEIQATTTERDAKQGELDASEGSITGRIGELAEQLSALESQRQGLLGQLPVPLYRRYEMIRQRRGTALAHTTDGTCSACHVSIPPMAFQSLKRATELTQCPNCRRLLYYKEFADVNVSNTDTASAEG